MVTEQDVRAKLVSLLTQDFRVPESKIRDDGTFRGTFGLDSLDVVDFVFLVQKSFGFKAEVASFADLHTLAAVVKFVHEKANAAAGTAGA